MFQKYGNGRVINGNKNSINLLPVFAWQLDNSRDISASELRVNVDRIQLETASFKQISNESNSDKKTMKEKIMGFVNARGKLHNPYTDTGGILSGRIDEIGVDCKNAQNFIIGDEVVVLVSTTMIPLYIDRIIVIDYALESITIEGYCILSDAFALIKKPANIGLALLMLTMEESASLFYIYKLAKKKSTYLIVGNSPMVCYLYACSIRKAEGKMV